MVPIWTVVLIGVTQFPSASNVPRQDIDHAESPGSSNTTDVAAGKSHKMTGSQVGQGTIIGTMVDAFCEFVDGNQVAVE